MVYPFLREMVPPVYTFQGLETSIVEHDPPLLYNLSIDPSERFDISASHPNLIAKIKEVVIAHNAKMVKGPDQLKDRDKINNIYKTILLS